MEQNQEKLTDETIAKMVQRGETEAFGWLLERYEEKMKRYARRFLSSERAEDRPCPEGIARLLTA